LIDAVLLPLEGIDYLSYNKDTGSSFSLLAGRGGMATFFFTTLASSKNLTSSSRV